MFVGKWIGRRLEVIFVNSRLLLSIGPRGNPAGAIEAGMVVHDGRVVNDGPIDVGIVNDSRVHVHHRGIVFEAFAGPSSAEESNASVPKAIVNPAVEADVRPPVAHVPAIQSTFKAPVARRPQHADSGRRDPNARNPVIAHRSVGPVAGRPEVPITWAGRLFVDRQDWRSNSDRYPNRNLG